MLINRFLAAPSESPLNIKVLFTVEGTESQSWLFTDGDNRNVEFLGSEQKVKEGQTDAIISIREGDLRRVVTDKVTLQELFLENMIKIMGKAEQVQYLTMYL